MKIYQHHVKKSKKYDFKNNFELNQTFTISRNIQNLFKQDFEISDMSRFLLNVITKKAMTSQHYNHHSFLQTDQKFFSSIFH